MSVTTTSAHAAFGIAKLRAGSSTAPENYVYTSGDLIVPQGSTDSGKYFRVSVRDSAGGVRAATACAISPAGGSLVHSYPVQPGDPPSTGTAWQYRLEQFTNPLCTGSPEKSASLYFTVARVTAYADDALSMPASVFAPGDTPHLRISGLGKVEGTPAVGPETDWDVTWLKPSGATACANDGGGERPDSSAAGTMPGPAGSWLQYPPNVADTGDGWNRESKYDVRPCPALAPGDQGQWKLALSQDGNHYVTLAAFTVSDGPPAPEITGPPPSPSADTGPSWSFTGSAASFECRIETSAGAAVSDWSACASPKAYDLTGQPDGDYVFRVRGVSATGTRGPDATDTYTLLASAPGTPAITSSPASPDNDSTPTWFFDPVPGATLECRLALGASVVSDWTACAGSESYDLTAEADGRYTFSVRAVSGTGVPGGPRTGDYELDRAVPAAPSIGSGPGTVGIDRQPQWSFAGEPGATFECRLERGGSAVVDWGPCSSPESYDLSAEPDGSYAFLVRATDAAGNTSGTATSAYELDASAPPAPSITASPASPAAGRNPAWSFSAAGGATTECRFEQGGAVVSDWTACAGSTSYDLTGAPDGGYDFLVRAVSAASVPGPPATDTYVLDTTAPAAPVITFSPGPVSSNRNPFWFFTAEADAAFECRLDGPGGPVAGWAACTSPADYDLTGQPDGAYTATVRATDLAGNTGPDATDVYTLDTTPPSAPAITFGPGAAGANEEPMWSFTGDPGVGFECRVARPGTTVIDWQSCTSPASFDLAAEPDADYTFAVRAVDPIGNEGSAATSDYTLDRAAPAAPAITGSPASPDNDLSPAWDFSGEAGATFECRVVRGATTVHDWATCTSGDPHDLTGEPDGTYTLGVRATDAAGNTGAAATGDYELDTTAPAAPSIDTAPGTPGSDAGPEWSFSAEAGASTECRLTSGATVVSDWGACTSPRSYDLTAQPDGTYTFAVRATDVAGNTGGAAQSDYELDRTVPPAPDIDSSPGALGSGRSPQWAFSGSGSASFECQVTRGATTIAAWHACTSPESVDLTAAPDGVYTFAVRGRSAGGLTGPATTDAYELDTTPPAVPVVTTAPPSPGATRSPSWGFTVDPGAQAQCRLDRGPTIVEGWSACTGSKSYALTGEPDGDYTFAVRAVDAAGNVGLRADSAYTLDTVAPAAPAITDAPASPGSGPTPAWGFTAPEPGGVLECRLTGGDAAGDWTPCASPQAYDLSSRIDAAYTFAVRATDAAGNTGPANTSGYELDRAGAAVRIASGPGPIGRDRAPSWTFESEAGASFQCALSGATGLLRDWSGCTDHHTETLDGADGVYVLDVRAADRVANLGASERARYELDTAPPAAPSVAGPGAEGTERRPTWTFTAEPGAAAQCRVDRGDTAVSDWADCTSPLASALPADGAYRFQVRARDAAGNTGPAGADAYRLDTTAPDPPAIRSSPGPAGTDRTPGWSFAAEEGASFECRLTAGQDTVFRRQACTSPWRYNLTREADAGYTFLVRAIDRVGNASGWTADDYDLRAEATGSDAGGGSAPPAAPETPSPSAEPSAPASAAKADDEAPPATAATPRAEPADAAIGDRAPGDDRPSGAGARPARRKAVPRTPAPGDAPPARGRSKGGNPAQQALRLLGQGVHELGEHADKSVFPISLIFLVVAFVVVQNRIDRSDPKLALAPLEREPDMTFGPPVVP